MLPLELQILTITHSFKAVKRSGLTTLLLHAKLLELTEGGSSCTRGDLLTTLYTMQRKGLIASDAEPTTTEKDRMTLPDPIPREWRITPAGITTLQNEGLKVK